MGRLETSNGGESPAGSALALVFDRRHTAMVLPVPLLRHVSSLDHLERVTPLPIRCRTGLFSLGLHLVHVESRLDFLETHRGELVNSAFEAA